jgi:hypothetical protein
MGAIALDWIAVSCVEPPESRERSRPYVDLSSVPENQWEIHAALEEWRRWCNSPSGRNVAPMFQLYRSADSKREYGAATSVPLNRDLALRVAKVIADPQFPYKQRMALQWFYLKPKNPKQKAKELGVSLEGLAELVRVGRQMLKNRGV